MLHPFPVVFFPSVCLTDRKQLINRQHKTRFCRVYHYTSVRSARLILDGGFRMSTVGQGDGGVYFSTLSPASYELGSENYERNIIVDCFGKERLEEYRGKHLLDVCLVYALAPEVLQPAPGGRENAVMYVTRMFSLFDDDVFFHACFFLELSNYVRSTNQRVGKRTFEDLSLRHPDGCFYLRADRIAGALVVETTAKSEDNQMQQQQQQHEPMKATKRTSMVVAAAAAAGRRMSSVVAAMPWGSEASWSLEPATPFARRRLRRERAADRRNCALARAAAEATGRRDRKIALVVPPAGVTYSMAVEDSEDEEDEWRSDEYDDEERKDPAINGDGDDFYDQASFEEFPSDMSRIFVIPEANGDEEEMHFSPNPMRRLPTTASTTTSQSIALEASRLDVLLDGAVDGARFDGYCPDVV